MAGHLDPTGIIDIGSNSVRFVAYGGNRRVPSHLFNEKISPALGRGVEADGRMGEEAMTRAMAALARFRQLAKDMHLAELHVLATAAVRDASNGAEFLDAVRGIGLEPRVVTGEEEAELAAYGVISAIPAVRGIVADLGGGSLELCRVADGSVGDRLSLPYGVLRVGNKADGKELAKRIRSALVGRPLGKRDKRDNLYLVGGSFRAIARLDLYDGEHSLPIVHQHVLTGERLAAIDSRFATSGFDSIRGAAGVSASRVEAFPAARAVLDSLIEVLEPAQVIVSAFGLREGLLFRALDESTRRQDPLLAGALEFGNVLGRFGDHGATIDRWIDPLFPDDDGESRRLRLAACLMCDFAWDAHPDFRADRAVDMALHGNWVGIDAHGRAVVGQALSAAFASENGLPDDVSALLFPEEVQRAKVWGRAIRLAQRLSGGTESTLLRSSLALAGDDVVLKVPSDQQDLVGEIVRKRLEQLARLLDRRSRIDLS
jgi:exopolyphosphatase/guanosine-5'-triphosphate,3'-diphosphate pyrophosphatase